MFLDVWVAAATVAALVLTLAFVVRYAVMMRWEETATGRSIMALSVALTVAEASAVVRRVDELAPGVDVGTLTTVLAAMSWTGIAAVFVWRHWALTHPHEPPEDDDAL